MMLGCPGAPGHLLANQTLLFEASLCRPTAPGLPIWGTGHFGTSPIFGQLSDKPLLASNQVSGVWGRKAQWRIEILMPTKKRFLWCWRRRPLVRPEVAASGALDRVRRPTGFVAWWAFAGLVSNLPGPKTRAAICSNSCMAEPKTSTPKGFPPIPHGITN